MENILVNKVVCVFPVFCASDKLFKKNKESIQSFIEFLKTNPDYLTGEKHKIKLDIIYGGYSYKDEWWNELYSLIKSNIPDAKTYRFDRNYGKSKIVSKLFADYYKKNQETQFLFTMDSDIKFIPSQELFFDRLLLASNALQQYYLQNKENKPFGMLALNQGTEEMGSENCHWLNTHVTEILRYNITERSDIAEELGLSPSGQGIAGGCLLINAKAFNSLNFYSQFNQPYAGEDGFILQTLVQNNFCVAVIKTLNIIHPPTTDDLEYIKYKQECMKHTWEKYDVNEYKKSLDESDNFWKNYNDKANILETISEDGTKSVVITLDSINMAPGINA